MKLDNNEFIFVLMRNCSSNDEVINYDNIYSLSSRIVAQELWGNNAAVLNDFGSL